MLSFTCIFMYLLQLSLEFTTSQTKRDISSYWKTTDVTDKVLDYWNHGPIVMPRLQDSSLNLNATTKKHDTPAWLPKQSTESSNSTTKTEANTLVDESLTPKSLAVNTSDTTYRRQTATEVSRTTPTVMTTTSDILKSNPVITESISTRITSVASTSITKHVADATAPKFNITVEQTSLLNPKSIVTSAQPSSADEEYKKTPVYYNYGVTQRLDSTIPMTTTHTATTITKQHLTQTITHPELRKNRAIENIEIMTDPFSIFMGKFFKVLSVKSLTELPLLIEQFKNYISILLTSGQLSRLGVELNSLIAKMILMLDHIPLDVMREYFETIHNLLENRKKMLSKPINILLDYIDDMYDEAEEEAMQAVLYETALFPNTKNKNKVAQGFVDYVFLKPILRVAGTLRGNILFQMIITAVKRRNEPVHNEDKRTEIKPRGNKLRNQPRSSSKAYSKSSNTDGKTEANDKTIKRNIGAVRKNFRTNPYFGKNYKKSLEVYDTSNKKLGDILEITREGKERYDWNRDENSNHLNSESYKIIAQSGEDNSDERSAKHKNKLIRNSRIKMDESGFDKASKSLVKSSKYENAYNKTTVYESLIKIKRRIQVVLNNLENVINFVGNTTIA